MSYIPITSYQVGGWTKDLDLKEKIEFPLKEIELNPLLEYRLLWENREMVIRRMGKEGSTDWGDLMIIRMNTDNPTPPSQAKIKIRIGTLAKYIEYSGMVLGVFCETNVRSCIDYDENNFIQISIVGIKLYKEYTGERKLIL